MSTMRRLLTLALAPALMSLAAACVAVAQDTNGDASVAQQPEDPHRWPRSFEEDGAKFVVYQPELEKWDNVRLTARAAVSVETAVSPQPTFGVVWFDARTDVDKEERLVTLENLTLRASFPTAPDKGAAWLAGLKKAFPANVKTVDLDRLEASLALLTAETKGEHAPLKNDPPKIFFSSTPAILVLIDGKPVLRRVEGSPLMRVINTRALLLDDEKASRFYLGVGDRWLVAASLDGPWTVAPSAPEGGADAKQALVASKHVDLYADDVTVAKLLAANEAPLVFTSTVPAELIETSGELAFAPVAGTKLLWAKNTDADVFVDTAANEQYVLVSGRWFRAATRQGPWAFVGGKDLPADFARIPNTDPAGEVLASVPGTPQAQEAAIANGIPQTATVKRSDAKLTTVYDGAPDFGPIEGTQLTYALNSATPVIRVGDTYYACEDGVWFTSASPTGPWVVASTVPAAIYSIPPSSPVYYTTYVHVYDSDADNVYEGYTPGYLGTCLDYDGCVVWGTGWGYSPWLGREWYGRPWTYGFGVGMRWNAGSGWGFGLSMGSRPPSRPWWGPLGSARAASYPSHWAGADFHVNINNGNIYSHRQGAVVRPQTFVRPAVNRPNDHYSSPEGNVYRQTQSGWEQHGTANPSVERAQGQRLDAQRNAREQGAQRARNNWRASNPAPQRQQQQSRPQQQQSRPQQISPGLRGGSVRHR
jgi:hypothetical protein